MLIFDTNHVESILMKLLYDNLDLLLLEYTVNICIYTSMFFHLIKNHPSLHHMIWLVLQIYSLNSLFNSSPHTQKNMMPGANRRHTRQYYRGSNSPCTCNYQGSDGLNWSKKFLQWAKNVRRVHCTFHLILALLN